MFVDGNVLPVCMTTNVDRTNNVVIAYVSVVPLLVPVRTTTNVDGARNAVIKNALVVRLLVPVHTTTNVTVASSAVIANASVNRLLVPARTTTNVTLERIVVREFVPHTVVGAVELLQALLSARLSSWPSSFPSYPAAAVLVVRTTAIVHPVLWSSPANRNNKWSQPTWWRRNKYMLLRRWTTSRLLQMDTTSLLQQVTASLLQLVTTSILQVSIRLLRLTQAVHH